MVGKTSFDDYVYYKERKRGRREKEKEEEKTREKNSVGLIILHKFVLL